VRRRPRHLYDPHWTLHAAPAQGYGRPGRGVAEPRARRKPQTGRDRRPKPRLSSSRRREGTRHHGGAADQR
jgi:anthraniloyl-CoA monooxygenase